MTEIKPTYVTFEQAQGFKDKGLDFWCKYRYTDFNGIIRLEEDASELHPVAPEQWQVIEWASLVHNIDIEARPVRYAGDIKTSYYQSYINGCIINMSKFSTRQQAYSAAFDYVLNNLI